MRVPMPRMRLNTTVASYWRVLKSVMSAGMNRGDSVIDFEQLVSKYVGADYAVAMPQARVGIYLSIKALVQPGQNVILSPYTISDVVNMVICAGAVPVFADIERETCNIDPERVAALINDDTGAVLITHFYGLACDVEKINAICAPRGVPVIEDAAQAFGTRIGNRLAGTLGDVGVFSFGMIKTPTSFFGGMVVSNNGEFAKRIREMIDACQPQSFSRLMIRVMKALLLDVATYQPVFRILTYRIFRLGHLKNIKFLKQTMNVDLNPVMRRSIPKNYLVHWSPLQARVVLEQIPLVDDRIKTRIAAAQMYHDGLKDIDGLILPPLRTDRSHSYCYFPIQCNERDKLVDHCMRQHRDIGASHHRNCASMACFKDYQRDCPNSEAVARSLVYLPTYPSYTESEIKENIRVIRDFFASENLCA
jgi:perosamine synthetase